MVLLRRVIGDALRARRQGQHRTLREVSSAANVSLGYLSEIERGQKEASSELLAAICDALGARLSELLREVSDTVASAEQTTAVLVPVSGRTGQPSVSARRVGPGAATPRRVTGQPVRTGRAAVQPRSADGSARGRTGEPARQVTPNGEVSVSVHQDSPLQATLRTTRRLRTTDRDRDVVCVA